MKFTEHEMTTALTGLAKHNLALAHPESEDPDFDVDAAWESLPMFTRYQALSSYGDLVLAVLVALPDVDVTPGTQPTFTDDETLAAAKQVVADREALVDEDAVRLYLTTCLALMYLSVRLDADGLLTEDSLGDFVVPDTLEGI